jgi:hypothetical protein
MLILIQVYIFCTIYIYLLSIFFTNEDILSTEFIYVFLTQREQEKFEDTKGAIRSRKSKIPKGQSEAVNLRYQRGNQKP